MTLLVMLEFRLPQCFDVDPVDMFSNDRFFLLMLLVLLTSLLFSYPTKEPVIDIISNYAQYKKLQSSMRTYNQRLRETVSFLFRYRQTCLFYEMCTHKYYDDAARRTQNTLFHGLRVVEVFLVFVVCLTLYC